MPSFDMRFSTLNGNPSRRKKALQHSKARALALFNYTGLDIALRHASSHHHSAGTKFHSMESDYLTYIRSMFA